MTTKEALGGRAVEWYIDQIVSLRAVAEAAERVREVIHHHAIWDSRFELESGGALRDLDDALRTLGGAP